MVRGETNKVYEGVLAQLRAYMDENKLQPGDKLPSERELSEQLKVGRSSIREALRALELLGLIETRKGEGTFLCEYHPYYLVELLSSFLLTGSRTKDELYSAKRMLEKEVLILMAGRLSKDELDTLQHTCSEANSDQRYERFFHELFKLSGHRLLYSMWQFIHSFSRSFDANRREDLIVQELITLLKNGSSQDVHSFYTYT